MKQNTEVVAIDAELAANLVFALFLEEHGAEKLAVTGGNARQGGADLLSGFFCYQ